MSVSRCQSQSLLQRCCHGVHVHNNFRRVLYVTSTANCYRRAKYGARCEEGNWIHMCSLVTGSMGKEAVMAQAKQDACQILSIY